MAQGGRGGGSLEDLSPSIMNTRVHVLPGQVFDRLGMMLFHDMRGASGNWESVAEELGVTSHIELEEIRRRAHVEQTFPGSRLLKDWGNCPGSTVFVLLMALRKPGREDCVDYLVQACQALNSMQLHVHIEEDQPSRHQFVSVSTKLDATLASSLENVLNHLPSYIIVGPDPNITWNTLAKHLKGKQLSLKRVQVTDDTIMATYGSLESTREKQPVFSERPVRSESPQTDHWMTNLKYDSPPVSEMPLNIPVPSKPKAVKFEQPTTTPKQYEYSLPRPVVQNNLSGSPPKCRSNQNPEKCGNQNAWKQNHAFHGEATNENNCDKHWDNITIQTNWPSLSETDPFTFTDATAPKGLVSMDTYPKQALSEAAFYNQRTLPKRCISMEEQATCLKTCVPMESRRELEHFFQRSMSEQGLNQEYVSLSHPIIQFSNEQDLRTGVTKTESESEINSLKNSKQVSRPEPVYVNTPAPCRAKNEVYVSHDSLLAGQGKTSSPDSLKPVPCYLQQRQDGYVDVAIDNSVEKCVPSKTNRSKSVPNLSEQNEDAYTEYRRQYSSETTMVATPSYRSNETGSAGDEPRTKFCPGYRQTDNYSNPYSVQKERVNADPLVIGQRSDGYLGFAKQVLPPKELGTNAHFHQNSATGSAHRLIRQGSDGYFGLSEQVSRMSPDARASASDRSFLGGAATMVVGQGEDGYFGFAGQASNMFVDRMEDETSSGPSQPQGPLVIGERSDGYFGFGFQDANVVDSNPTERSMVIGQDSNGYLGFAGQNHSVESAPPPCASGYTPMSQTPSRNQFFKPAPCSRKVKWQLSYSSIYEGDEEEGYIDMSESSGNSSGDFQSTGSGVTDMNRSRYWSTGALDYLDILDDSNKYDYIPLDGASANEQCSMPVRLMDKPPLPARKRRSQSSPMVTSGSQQTPKPIPPDLQDVPGWCPQETEDTIKTTMHKFKDEDGNFVVWKMQRKNQFVISVSHLGEIRHYAIHERVDNGKVFLFIFKGGPESEFLADLIGYYQREGLKGPDPRLSGHRGKKWQKFAHVRLKTPLSVKYVHSVVRKRSN